MYDVSNSKVTPDSKYEWSFKFLCILWLLLSKTERGNGISVCWYESHGILLLCFLKAIYWCIFKVKRFYNRKCQLVVVCAYNFSQLELTRYRQRPKSCLNFPETGWPGCFAVSRECLFRRSSAVLTHCFTHLTAGTSIARVSRWAQKLFRHL